MRQGSAGRATLCSSRLMLKVFKSWRHDFAGAAASCRRLEEQCGGPERIAPLGNSKQAEVIAPTRDSSGTRKLERMRLLRLALLGAKGTSSLEATVSGDTTVGMGV